MAQIAGNRHGPVDVKRVISLQSDGCNDLVLALKQETGHCCFDRADDG
jgi:hypothetical protein